MEMDHTLAPATGARDRRCAPVAVSEESPVGDVRVHGCSKGAGLGGIPAQERHWPRGWSESAIGSVPKVLCHGGPRMPTAPWQISSNYGSPPRLRTSAFESHPLWGREAAHWRP